MSFLSQVASTVPNTHTVTYSCKFTNNWSGTNHPVNYPSSNAHWSPPIIAAHSKRYVMWEPNALATEGVEIVAESGGPTTLLAEIETAQDERVAGDRVRGVVTFNKNAQSQILSDITLTPVFDRMSSITMIAPSPDWFTGFYNIHPVDESSDFWLQSFEIETFPWDAGTEQGDTFSGDNPAEDPHVSIFQLTKDTVPANGVLLNLEKTEVLPMATWSCALTSNECSDHDGVMFDGSSDQDCAWAGNNGNPGRRNLKNNKRSKSSKSNANNNRCGRGKRFEGEHISNWCPNACGKC